MSLPYIYHKYKMYIYFYCQQPFLFNFPKELMMETLCHLHTCIYLRPPPTHTETRTHILTRTHARTRFQTQTFLDMRVHVRI